MNIFTAIEILNKNQSVDLCKKASGRIICSNYVNDKIINKYKPFNIWSPYRASEETYKYLLDNFPDLKYEVCKALIMARYNDLYFKHNFEAEIELFRTAAKTANKEVYDDQLKKAKKLGKFYVYFDMENEQILNEPKFVSFEDGFVEMKFDYESMFCN